MSEWLQLYTFDTIGALTFGKPFGFLEKGTDLADIMSTIHTYSRYGAVMGVFAEWHPTVFGLLQMVAPKGNVGLAYVHQFAADAMAEHGKKPVDVNDILNDKKTMAETEESGILKTDYLTTLYARHRMDPKAFDEGSIYYHILSNVIAGAETTGIALSAVFYYLDRHRSVLAKLRAEVDAFMQNRKAEGPIMMKEALEMTYLQAVLKEALRMFPSAGLPLPRIVPKGGLTLAGQFFPEGTTVGINAWAAHANRYVYGLDADEFRPERWLGDQASRNRMEQYFFTFGRGPRSCSGKAITMMEMSKLVPELVLRYDIGLADPRHDWTVCNDWFVRQYDFLCTVGARK
ncbi:hypothetical protein MMC30_004818 [Trapelia coarctata]|nr:hypothetical protein [Trapelia coarctata]